MFVIDARISRSASGLSVATRCEYALTRAADYELRRVTRAINTELDDESQLSRLSRYTLSLRSVVPPCVIRSPPTPRPTRQPPGVCMEHRPSGFVGLCQSAAEVQHDEPLGK